MWNELILALPEPRVVALTGGGGKTSLMAWMYDELTRSGVRVVVTSTTKLSAVEPRGFSYAEVHSLEQAAMVSSGQVSVNERTVLVRGPVLGRPEKMQGLPSEWIDALADGFPEIVFLVEADGSAGFPLKGHLSHEPVIPASTRLVIPVVGMDGMRSMPPEKSVFRLGRFYELAGLEPGESVTPSALTKVMFHPDGYLRGMPTDATVMPFLNKVESLGSRIRASNLQETILSQRVPRLVGVAIGSAVERKFSFEPARVSAVAGVILAAGASCRMGESKPLLLLNGETLVRIVAQEALRSRLGEVLVVVGAQADLVKAALVDLPLRFLSNSDWEQGQSSSLIAGLLSTSPDMRAVVFLLADQPLVTAALIDRVIAAYEDSGDSIVAPRCGERIGNPVLFDRNKWESQLLNLTGDVGARSILRANPGEIRFVETDNVDVFLDVDTLAEYEYMCRLWERKTSGKSIGFIV